MSAEKFETDGLSQPHRRYKLDGVMRLEPVERLPYQRAFEDSVIALMKEHGVDSFIVAAVFQDGTKNNSSLFFGSPLLLKVLMTRLTQGWARYGATPESKQKPEGE